MALDLSVPYYAFNFLRAGQDLLETLDPLLQVGIVGAAIALVTKGSAVALLLGLCAAIYIRLWFLDTLPRTLKVAPGDEGDADRQTNDSLMEELKALDPDGKYGSLYASPAIFHLLHQVIFMRRLAQEAFERVLAAADHYIEGAMEIKRTDNLRDVAVLLEQSIERAETVVKEFASMALKVPLSSDAELASRFKDTLSALRIVLRRDLLVLRKLGERVINRSASSWEPLPNVDAPRPWE